MAPFLESIKQERESVGNNVNKTQVSTQEDSAAQIRTTAAILSEPYEHSHLLPSFPDVSWPPLEEVPYEDKGLLGDSDYRHLLASATDSNNYSPKIGTEIHGVDLATLTDNQKNDLARLIGYRGVVVFRDQANFDIEKQRELGRYYGVLHKHATTSVPIQQGLEDVHVVHTDGAMQDMRAVFKPSFLWHSDVSIVFPISGTTNRLSVNS